MPSPFICVAVSTNSAPPDTNQEIIYTPGIIFSSNPNEYFITTSGDIIQGQTIPRTPENSVLFSDILGEEIAAISDNGAFITRL